MARRPIFVSTPGSQNLIEEKYVNFEWSAGLALTQKQKSIDSLHRQAKSQGIGPILEISSKSINSLGVKLSAFNLIFKMVGKIETTVESAYQGSKVFSNGGPYIDLYKKNSREAKKNNRLLESGKLIGFEFEGIKWSLFPETSFYDWLYINALVQNEELAIEISNYNSFTDIEYNPKKQISCQARSAAYFVSLTKLRLLKDFISSKEDFLQLYKQSPSKTDQYRLQL